MKTGRIFIVRHGQTTWNKQRYLGQEDIPLDEAGIKQSEAIASYFDNEEVDRIYSSPLARALETIKPFAEKRQLAVVVSNDLKEMHYGEWQGRMKSETKLDLKQRYRHNPLPGGESLFDVYQRAGRFMERLKNDLAEGRHLVIVGHFQINQMLFGVIRRLPFSSVLDQSDYRPGNGSIFDMKYTVDPGGGVQVNSFRFIGNNF